MGHDFPRQNIECLDLLSSDIERYQGKSYQSDKFPSGTMPLDFSASFWQPVFLQILAFRSGSDEIESSQIYYIIHYMK